MKKQLNILKRHAKDNGWSQSAYDIVENDIKHKRFESVKDLLNYLD